MGRKSKENEQYNYIDTLPTGSPIWWDDNASMILYNILATSEFKYCKKVGDEKLYYCNMAMAFDIEDSSFYNGNNKVSTMYVWQFGINHVVFMGRTWEEFKSLIDTLNKACNPFKRCIVYVHYLSHEFQFIRRLFDWSKVFSTSQRNPIYAITGGVEFRDSYILTSKSLASVGNDLRDKTYVKKVGDLDYRKIRGCETPLSDAEIGYCMGDVQVLNTLIAEKIEDEKGNIGRIPLTKTGYVRRYVRKKCLKQGDGSYYHMIHGLTLEPEEYMLLKQAFQGGFTHASPYHVFDHVEGRIDSIDFTSSYPTQMVSKPYPIGKGRKETPKSQEELDYICKHRMCVFVIRFTNIRMKDTVYDCIISESKCYDTSNVVVSNGRVVRADKLTTCMTNIDLDCVKRFYDYDYFNLGTTYSYKAGYLPRQIIESVLELYKDKTTLKGVNGMESEYIIKKEMLNSLYGMMVMDVVRPDIIYDNEDGWTQGIADTSEQINKYNESENRFTFYPWGVFITSWARAMLYSGILEFGKDYLYSDTDSIKCINLANHMTYVNRYNDYITRQINKVLASYNINPDNARPKNIKEVPKPLGVWDIETEGNPISDFKTLGAKRYIYTDNDGLHITVAGVSKKSGKDAIASHDNPYDFFEDKMELVNDQSGKLTHTYLDYEQDGTMTDYMGNTMEYHEKSSVHLEPSPYLLSVRNDYRMYCQGFRKARKK